MALTSSTLDGAISIELSCWIMSCAFCDIWQKLHYKRDIKNDYCYQMNPYSSWFPQKNTYLDNFVFPFWTIRSTVLKKSRYFTMWVSYSTVKLNSVTTYQHPSTVCSRPTIMGCKFREVHRIKKLSEICLFSIGCKLKTEFGWLMNLLFNIPKVQCY